MAGGVSSGRPEATSPIAKMFGIEVYSEGETFILQFFSSSIPISRLKGKLLSQPSFIVSG